MNLIEMQQVFENGSFQEIQEAMTRTEFYQFMQKGVKGLLADAYQSALADTTYQEIVVVESSDSDKEDYPSIGQPSLPREKGEGLPYETLNSGSPDNVPVTNFTYGGIVELTDEADKDDKSPAKSLRKQAAELGPNHAKFKDKVFYSIINANATCYDGQALFSLNHPGYNGGAARGSNDNIYTNVTMSANALATVLGMIAQWEGADPDQDLDVVAQKVVCPKTLQQTAYGLTHADLLPLSYAAGPLGPSTTGGAVGMPNAMKGKLSVVSSHRLDRASITDWYVKTSFPGLLYQPREGLSVLAEAPNSGKSFENGVLRWRSSERFGRRAISWRGFLKVS